MRLALAFGTRICSSALLLALSLLSARAQPQIFDGGVVNGASFAVAPAPVAPGSIIALFGTNLAAATSAAASLPLPTSIGGVQVFLNGVAAPLFFVSPGQINLQVPWQLSGSNQMNVQVALNGVSSNTVTVNLAAVAPGCFTVNQAGQGAILFANTSVLAAPDGSVPGMQTASAKPGDYLALFCTGLGEVTNPPASGAAGLSSPLSTTLAAPSVAIGGANSAVIFSGLAPGYAGLYQVNAQVPGNVPGGDAVPVLVAGGGMASNWTTISVQNTAPLILYRLAMAQTGAGKGTLTANPTGPSYPARTSVTVTAIPDAGSVFAGWSGACSGSGACKVTLDADKQVTATFSPASVGISLSPAAATVRAASTQQFTATVTGSANTAVTWSVNQIAGGNADAGTISATGLYTAPTSVPANNTVTVRAVSVADATNAASGTVMIVVNPFLGILEGATSFSGPYPTPAAVTYRNASGQTEQAMGYPGQVLVFFRPATTEAAATAAIQAARGQVIEKIPKIGYYMAQVPVGGEAAFISYILQSAQVSLAIPNSAGVFSGAPDVHAGPEIGLIPVPITTHGLVAIDDIDVDGHGLRVAEAACNAGACITDIVNTHAITTPGPNGTFYLPANKLTTIISQIVQGANSGGSSTPVYIDISTNGVAADKADTAAALAAWKGDVVTKLQAVANLPASARSQVVLTLSAGNDGLDIGPALVEISSNPVLYSVLVQNCIIATTGLLPQANRAANNLNVVTINNLDAADGTSFAAPAVLAYVKQIMDTAGVTPSQAIVAVKSAAATNAKHELVLSEAITIARMMRGTVSTYSGTYELTVVILDSNTSGCTPNPLPQTWTVKGGEVRLMTGTPIESAGRFSGNLWAFPSSMTVTIAAQICGCCSTVPPWSSESWWPGFLCLSSGASDGWTSSGTSDGKIFSIPMQYDFVGALNPPPMTGTISAAGSSVTLTLEFKNSSTLLGGEPVTTVFSATLFKQ
jgi:uncharacterized protein (TIGR03437 family)